MDNRYLQKTDQATGKGRFGKTGRRDIPTSLKDDWRELDWQSWEANPWADVENEFSFLIYWLLHHNKLKKLIFPPSVI